MPTKLAVLRPLEIVDHLGDAEQADGDRHEADAVVDVGDAERHARHAGIDVDADQAEQHADHDHGDRLGRRAVRQHDRAEQAENDQARGLDRRELQREGGERQAEQRDDDGRDRAGEERGDGGDGKRRAGASLLGHLVAVDAGDDRGGFAGDVDQNGGGRATVLRAVEDACQHDERGRRRQPERERQQHRHRGERRDAGQHADQRADHDAGEAEQQVLPGCRRGEPEREIVEQLHAILTQPTRSAPSPRSSRGEVGGITEIVALLASVGQGHSLNGRPRPFTNSSAENACDQHAEHDQLQPPHRRRGHASHHDRPHAGGDQAELGEQHRKQRNRCEDRDERPPRRRWNRRACLGEAGDQECRSEAQDDPRQRARDEAGPHVRGSPYRERAGRAERDQRQRDQEQAEGEILEINAQHGLTAP